MRGHCPPGPTWCTDRQPAQRYGRAGAARAWAVYSGPVNSPVMSGRDASVLRR